MRSTPGSRRPFRRSLQRFFDLGEAYKGVIIRQPAFCLTGEADGVNKIRPVDEVEMRRAVPELRGVRVLPDVGHWAHREAPDATITLLLDFLRGCICRIDKVQPRQLVHPRLKHRSS
jgi:pimeloyl-ACP methyl ester carboxylesterase